MTTKVVSSRRQALLLIALAALAGFFYGPIESQAQTKKTLASPIQDKLLPGVEGAEQIELINHHLQLGWDANKLDPSERCSDYEFIRRASLDIIGRIATYPEIKAYMAQPETTRRSWLIEKLLASEEYAENFAGIWSILLLTRSANEIHHEQMKDFLKNQFLKEVGWDETARELVTATGRTNTNGAVNFILAHLGEENKDKRGEGRFDAVPITSRTTKLFLGIQTQCTQCHDHPFTDVWQQKHFWSINAFYRQVDAPAGRPIVNNDNTTGGQFELIDNEDYNTEGIIPYERRNGVLLYAKARFLDGQRIPRDFDKPRREALADFIVHDSYFAKAFINRMWGHFFGISFTRDGVADFGEHNPVSHPELLDRLGRVWAEKYDHNPKAVIRWICNSRAYGLSSRANKTNTSSDSKRFFSRMLLKAMTPEQLFKSLMVATLADPRTDDEKKNREKMRREFLDRLIVNFGDDEGNGTTFNGTVLQALLLMNGKEINKAISDKKFGSVGILLNAKGMTPKKAIYYLFMASYNRPPTEKEYAKLLDIKMYRLYRLPLPNPNNRQEIDRFWTAYYQDLFWAILNTNEFFLNH